MDAPAPPLFDRSLHRRRLDRASGAYRSADFLKRRVAEDAADRLGAVNRNFGRALDLGSRGGLLAKALEALSLPAKIGFLVQADLAVSMAQPQKARANTASVLADEERLPFAEAGFDLVTALLNLHWTNDLVGALIQIRQVLKPDGLFIGAVFGGQTLTELRQCLLEAEIEIFGGAGPRVSPFADAIDGAGLLQRAGFALPVADVDRVTVRYAHPLALMQDLRAMGETNVLMERSRRPLTRTVLERMSQHYAERFALPDGRVPATFEIITLTGWAPDPSQPRALKPGSAKMRLADALGVEEGKLDPD